MLDMRHFCFIMMLASTKCIGQTYPNVVTKICGRDRLILCLIFKQKVGPMMFDGTGVQRLLYAD